KSANIRLGYAMAWDLKDTGITALSLSPGFLRSEAVLAHKGVAESNWRDGIARDPFFAESETPCFVGRAIVALACDPNMRAKAGGSYFAGDLAREYGFADIDGRAPDFWGNFDRWADAILARGTPLTNEEQFYIFSRYGHIHRDAAHSARATKLAQRLGIAGSGAGLQPVRP
ncbi:MAG TPA: hypothetical protein VEH07_00745, partial [Alphaproteobacteria bacterium]|nr:hypothetical protein [Alphaproteobacteria bacterium]